MGKNGGKYIVGAIIGAAAGAAAGLLFAPKSGKQTRKMIGEKAKEYAEKGKEMVVKEEKQVKNVIANVAEEISK